MHKYIINNSRMSQEKHVIKDNSNAKVMRSYLKIAEDHVSTDRAITPKALSLPTNVRIAYGLNTISSTGTGQIIAIVDAYAMTTSAVQNDLNSFCTRYSIPTTTIVSKIMTNSSGKQPTVNAGWGLEICLDVQYAHVLAPGATIMLVQAYSASFTDMMAAVTYAINNGATVVSMSWGSNEFAAQTTYGALFKPTNNLGKPVTYLASSGDVGGIMSWPCASMNVVGVGGTTLTMSATGQRLSETAWNGSGGGVSLVEPIQTYQKTYGLLGTKRQCPDVSFLGDPNTGVPVCYAGKYYQVGGTSLSCPCMAGVIAIANQLRMAASKKTLSTAAILTYLYGTKTNGKYATVFFDIIVGAAGTFTTKSGFDNITGLGSPKNTSVTVGMVAELVNLA